MQDEDLVTKLSRGALKRKIPKAKAFAMFNERIMRTTIMRILTTKLVSDDFKTCI